MLHDTNSAYTQAEREGAKGSMWCSVLQSQWAQTKSFTVTSGLYPHTYPSCMPGLVEGP